MTVAWNTAVWHFTETPWGDCWSVYSQFLTIAYISACLRSLFYVDVLSYLTFTVYFKISNIRRAFNFMIFFCGPVSEMENALLPVRQGA